MDVGAKISALILYFSYLNKHLCQFMTESLHMSMKISNSGQLLWNVKISQHVEYTHITQLAECWILLLYKTIFTQRFEILTITVYSNYIEKIIR